MDHDTAVKRSRQGELIIREIPRDFLFRDTALDEGSIEVGLQKGQGFHIIFLQDLHIAFLADLLVQLDLQLREYIGQFHGIHWFQYIFLHLQVDGPPGIFKLVKPGKEQDLRGRVFCLDPAGQFQAVHKGHPNICHDHIRLAFLHKLQCLHPVIGMSSHTESQSLPVDLFHDHMDNLFFIIHEKYRIVIHTFLRWRTSSVHVGNYLSHFPHYNKGYDKCKSSCQKSQIDSDSFRLFYCVLLFLHIFKTIQCHCYKNNDTGEYELEICIDTQNRQGICQRRKDDHAHYDT